MLAQSRQRAWQKRMVGQSRCAICGKPQGRRRGYCELHYRKHLLRMREIAGDNGGGGRGNCKAWIPGHTGRPPLGRTSQVLTGLAQQLKEMGYRIEPNSRKRRGKQSPVDVF